MKPNELLLHLKKIGLEAKVIRNERGIVAMFTAPGARMIGLWPNPESENLLWTNPILPDNFPCDGGWNNWKSGGVGGSRIWHGPEHRWFFEGAPQKNLSNYLVRPSIDPAQYEMSELTDELTFVQNVTLEKSAEIHMSRKFELTDKEQLKSVEFAIELNETRRMVANNPPHDFQIDFWEISQVHPHSWIVIPTNGIPKYSVSYEENAGEIAARVEASSDHLAWKVTGQGNVKGSLPASQVQGIVGVIRRCNETEFSLLIRRFDPDPASAYLDGLFPDQVNEQCIQWWDGFGFGEIETHSPTLTNNNMNISEHHQIRAYMGNKQMIKSLAEEELNCQISDHIFD